MDETSSQPGSETALAQWEQPERVGLLSKHGGLSTIWILGIVVAALMIAVAIWQREWNLIIAGVAILVGAAALQTQHRTPDLPVTITNARVIIGKREYPIATLAGFWVSDQGDVVEINLENSKPGLLPTTFLYAKPDSEEARSVMSQILPELEPREKKLGDNLSKYFKL